MKDEKEIDILLVEDSQDDIFLTDLAIKKADINGDLVVASNGKIAIQLLVNYVKTGKKLPDLILLDINLPKVSGLEVLKHIKSDIATSSIPTVMLTSSNLVSDMTDSYRNGAELYIKKLNNINDFKETIKFVKEYCLK